MTNDQLRPNDQPRVARAGQAGFLAALIMLAIQLIWRVNWSKDGVVQAFPEFIVAAIARLTPLSVFGAATESYGSLAKKSLFVGVVLGIAATGYGAGLLAERLSRRTGRMTAGFLVAGTLFLFTMLVVMPIAYLGAFAMNSSYTGDILLQLVVTFAIFAIAWATLSAPRVASAAVTPNDEYVSRRSVIGRTAWAAGTLAAIATVGGATWRLLNPVTRERGSSTAVTVGEDTTVEDIIATQRAQQGFPVEESTPTPSSEASVREVAELNADVTALQEDPFALFNELEAEEKLTPVLTEVRDFYHVSKNISDPRVSEEGWTLTVTGLVETDLELSYEDVLSRVNTDKITTLSCISNELNGSLIGTALWTGFPLRELLDEAKIKEGAIDIKFHCADDYEDSIPVAAGLDLDTLVVVSMNGEPLQDDHGYPARIIVPGIYGMKNVKWLDRIEVVDEDFKGYWQTRGWSDPAIPQIWARIDAPGSGEEIDPGQFIAAGVAAAGDRDVSRVEVSLDDGETWADAQIEPSINPPFTWVRWAFPFEATEGDHRMRIRATDGEGEVATEIERPPLPDGATGWPGRRVKVEG